MTDLEIIDFRLMLRDVNYLIVFDLGLYLRSFLLVSFFPDFFLSFVSFSWIFSIFERLKLVFNNFFGTKLYEYISAIETFPFL